MGKKNSNKELREIHERNAAMGLKPGSGKRYRSSMNGFEAFLKDTGRTVTPNSTAEKEAFMVFSDDYVTRQKKAGSSMTKTRCALAQRHRSLGLSRSWARQEEMIAFTRNLTKDGGQSRMNRKVVRTRAPFEEFMLDELKQMCRQIDEPMMAIVYHLLFFGMVRHGHVEGILRCDVTPRMGTNSVTLYVEGAKTDDEEDEAHWIQVSEFKPLLAEVLATRTDWKWNDQLFAGWSERKANRLLQKFMDARGYLMAYDVDVHCLRRGGADFYRSHGIDPNMIKKKALWTQRSRMLTTYCSGVSFHQMAHDMQARSDKTSMEKAVQMMRQRRKYVRKSRSRCMPRLKTRTRAELVGRTLSNQDLGDPNKMNDLTLTETAAKVLEEERGTRRSDTRTEAADDDGMETLDDLWGERSARTLTSRTTRARTGTKRKARQGRPVPKRRRRDQTALEPSTDGPRAGEEKVEVPALPPITVERREGPTLEWYPKAVMELVDHLHERALEEARHRTTLGTKPLHKSG